MTAWTHLPNAAAIDEVLADVNVRPEEWGAIWSIKFGSAIAMARGTLEDAVWGAITAAARDSAKAAAWRKPASPTAWTDAWRALEGVVAALAAWDSSADLLALTPDALRTIIETCDGDVKHQAVLLLPAVIARSTT